MKQILLILLLIYFPINNSFGVEISEKSDSVTSQVDSYKSELLNSTKVTKILEDTIFIKKNFTEVYGYKNGKLLKYDDYKVLFANNPVALNKIEFSKSHHKLGIFLGSVGGFMFGFIGVLGLKDIKSVDYTWGKALGISAAVTGVGFLVYKLGNSEQIQAINIYNGCISGNKVNKDISYLKVGFTNSGIGLSYNF